MNSSHKIKIENFEGPMDLLLFFIQRDHLNIYDIPIAYIAKEYFKYIEDMKNMDINIGAEFIYMASLLINIKTKMLLPKTLNNLNEEIEDPRIPLINRLLEYKMFKQISQSIGEKYIEYQKVYTRGQDLFSSNITNNNEKNINSENIYILSKYFHKMITKTTNYINYEIKKEEISVDKQINYIKNKLKNNKTIAFKSLDSLFINRISIVVTFMAILEMVQKKIIKVKQDLSFDSFVIIRQ